MIFTVCVCALNVFDQSAIVTILFFICMSLVNRCMCTMPTVRFIQGLNLSELFNLLKEKRAKKQSMKMVHLRCIIIEHRGHEEFEIESLLKNKSTEQMLDYRDYSQGIGKEQPAVTRCKHQQEHS